MLQSGRKNKPEEIARAVKNNEKDWNIAVDNLKNCRLTKVDGSVVAQEISLKNFGSKVSGVKKDSQDLESFSAIEKLRRKRLLEKKPAEKRRAVTAALRARETKITTRTRVEHIRETREKINKQNKMEKGT
ncbi:MAG: hypothetical protein LBB24_00900 [Rickettsiales bacterium]|jgi:hypothetical protein|nr:hypothetical protein [Rickettsiales bacterium]